MPGRGYGLFVAVADRLLDRGPEDPAVAARRARRTLPVDDSDAAVRTTWPSADGPVEGTGSSGGRPATATDPALGRELSAEGGPRSGGDAGAAGGASAGPGGDGASAPLDRGERGGSFNPVTGGSAGRPSAGLGAAGDAVGAGFAEPAGAWALAAAGVLAVGAILGAAGVVAGVAACVMSGRGGNSGMRLGFGPSNGSPDDAGFLGPAAGFGPFGAADGLTEASVGAGAGPSSGAGLASATGASTGGTRPALEGAVRPGPGAGEPAGDTATAADATPGPLVAAPGAGDGEPTWRATMSGMGPPGRSSA